MTRQITVILDLVTALLNKKIIKSTKGQQVTLTAGSHQLKQLRDNVENTEMALQKPVLKSMALLVLVCKFQQNGSSVQAKIGLVHR